MSRLVRKAKHSGSSSAEREGGALKVATVLLLATGLAACGTATSTSGSSSEVVARVGSAAIDRAEVDHWVSAISRGNSVGTALGQMKGTPRERALRFLVSSNWLIGEAKEQGLSISSTAVERGLRTKTDEAPNGRSEFQEELASTGQRLADVKLEVKSILAVKSLRDAVAKRVPPVTRAEVISYYAHHRRSFYLPDRRVAYLIEGIRDYSHAVALGRQVRPGVRLMLPWFRELVSRTPEARDPTKLAHMIFTATPGRVAGPSKFFDGWVLAVVRKLIPAGIPSLAAVRAKLSKSLAVEHRERALTKYAEAFVRKWTARTSCSPGYVVQGCSEYGGALMAEGNPLTGASG